MWYVWARLGTRYGAVTDYLGQCHRIPSTMTPPKSSIRTDFSRMDASIPTCSTPPNSYSVLGAGAYSSSLMDSIDLSHPNHFQSLSGPTLRKRRTPPHSCFCPKRIQHCPNDQQGRHAGLAGRRAARLGSDFVRDQSLRTVSFGLTHGIDTPDA